jgi:hypothetical protein
MGLERMVSKHRESTYRSGRFDRWIKVKNRQHPRSPACRTGSKQDAPGMRCRLSPTTDMPSHTLRGSYVPGEDEVAHVVGCYAQKYAK